MIETIVEDSRRHLLIRADDTPSMAMNDLLGRTVWGSDNTRYRALVMEEKLRLLAGSRFISLEQGGPLVGVYVRSGKRVLIDDSEYPAYYRTFLAVEPSRAGRSLPHRRNQRPVLAFDQIPTKGRDS